MTEFIQSAATWGGHAAVAGAVVFALGWAWLRRTGGPERRRALAVWVVRGGLVAAVLCVFPAWLLLPPPHWDEAPAPPPVTARALPPEIPAAAIPAAAPERWVVVAVPAADLLTVPPPPVADAPGEAVVPPPAEAPPPPAPKPVRAPTPAASPTHRPSVQEAPPSVGVGPLLLLAYAVGVTVAAVPLALGVVALVRLRRSGRPAPAAVQAVFDELAAGSRARLLVSDRVASPLCFGLFRPVVVIPRGLAGTATEAELRWVFAHELDHLRRGDPWNGWWVGVARAVYFFVPWFWHIRRELVLAQEQLADAAAVAAGGRGEDYAAFLVRLSGDPAGRRHPVGAAGVRGGKSDLFWRVTMLLSSKDKSPARASRRWTLAAAGGVLGTAVVLSGVGFASPVQDEKKTAEKRTEKTDKPKEAKPAPAADVQVGPPPELAALRKVVEDAAKKGENVDDIRKQLEELEKALAGKAWKKPAFVPDAPPVPPRPGFDFQPPPVARVMPPNIVFPPGADFNFNFGGIGDPEAMKKAQAVLEKAMEALKNNPNDPDVFDKAMKEYQKLMGEAFKGGANNLFANPNVFGGAVVVGPDGVVQRFPLGGDGRAVERAGGRNPNDGRLGIQVEKVPAVLVEQLGLEAGKGLVVSGVRDGSAAAKAGIKANDIILTFAGKPVTDNAAEFVRAVAAVKKDEKVDVTVLRKGKKEDVKGVEVPEAAVRGRGVPEFEPPAARAVPPFGGFRAVERPLPLPPREVGGGVEASSTSISINNGEFTIESTQDGVKFTITGSVEGGKAVPSKIKVVDGETKVDADTVEKVPAAYRDRVSKLLGSIRGGR